MEEITAEQFLESAKTWKPSDDFEVRAVRQLREAKAPEEMIPALGGAFLACAKSTYDYIQYIHELKKPAESPNASRVHT